MKLTTQAPLALCVSVVTISLTSGFVPIYYRHGVPSTARGSSPSSSFLITQMAKGFGGGGGGGFGATKSKNDTNKKPKKSQIKKTQKKIVKKYGTNIAEGTQKRVEKAMQDLPPHLYVATQLYQQLQKWKVRVDNMSLLQQAQIPQEEMEGANRAQEELDRLYKEHDFTENDLHNIFQQITWDASADAKAARALTGSMPKEIQSKVDKACQIVAEQVLSTDGDIGRCLDVGCGYGVLVPHLLQAGLDVNQIHGIDLSPEMIKNAREQHRGVNFEAVDFMSDDDYPRGDKSGDGNDDGHLLFEGVIFCSALHDLPDPIAALEKAATLVKSGGGKLVVAHPQGASHVLRQSAANPVLVKRGLPTADEYKSMDLQGMKLEIEPAEPNSPQEAQDGYLAVLTKE